MSNNYTMLPTSGEPVKTKSNAYHDGRGDTRSQGEQLADSLDCPVLVLDTTDGNRVVQLVTPTCPEDHRNRRRACHTCGSIRGAKRVPIDQLWPHHREAVDAWRERFRVIGGVTYLTDEVDDGSCPICNADIGPSTTFPWHGADEDCRALQPPLTSEEVSHD